MRVRSRSCCFAVALASGLLGTAVGAQTPAVPTATRDTAVTTTAARIDSSPAAPGRAAILGRVHTPHGTAVSEAELTVIGGDTHRAGHEEGPSVRTGPGGAFRIDSIVPGRYFVRVRRLGYQPLYFSATLDRGAARRIDVELTPLPAQLSEVKVRARSGFDANAERRLRDFEFRRRAGFGRFYTRDDLHAYEGRLFTDALRFAWPFAGCRGYGAYTSSYAGAARFGGFGNVGRGCPVVVSIDGQPAQPLGFAIDLPVSQIEAMEIYRPGDAPPQFVNGSTYGAALVVIWTGTESSD